MTGTVTGTARHGDVLRGLLRGRARRAVAALPGPVVLCDLYDVDGAEVYHDTGTLDPSEVPELLRLARRGTGPLLELAAGSGRLTFPLLRTGRPITAVELSPDMAAILRREAARLPSSDLEVVEADMTDFDLGRRYATVILGASSLSLVDGHGRRGLYAAVRRHLAPGGRFLLTVADAVPADAGPCDEQHELRGRSGRSYRLHQHWQPGEDRRTVCVYPLDHPCGPTPVCVSRPRVLAREQVLAELDAAGLPVLREHPVRSGGPLVRDVLLEAGSR